MHQLQAILGYRQIRMTIDLYCQLSVVGIQEINLY